MNEEFTEAELIEDNLKAQLDTVEAKDPEDLDKSPFINKKRAPGRPRKGEKVLKPIKRDKPGRPPLPKEEGAQKNGAGRPPSRHLPNDNQILNYRQKVYMSILKTLEEDMEYEDKLILIANEFSANDLYFKDRFITLEQCVFLSIFEHNLCNEYEALKIAGIESMRTLYNWKATNKHFLIAYNFLMKERIKLVEQVLFEDAINNKNPVSCMFLLKKLSRDKYGDNDNTNQETKIVGTNLVPATKRDN